MSAGRIIPISTVDIGRDVEDLVLDVLRSGMLAQGPMVERLEALFAQLVGVRHAIAVNNGTTALIAALQVLDLRPGDEVITSPFTFVATLNAILQTGATARFADIGDDFNVDPDNVRSLVTPRSRAVVPVHLYGQSADMERIGAIAHDARLAIVEDAAQAHGATFNGRPVGSFGIGCFSLYATKNITTGEGGVITTNDDALADRLRLLRNQGMRARYAYEIAGQNLRLTDLQAAVGVPQLERVSEIIETRRENAAYLSKHLSDVVGIEIPIEFTGREHVWHQYTVRVTGDGPLTRDRLAERLAADGIGTGVYYPKVVFDYDCYRSDPRVIEDAVPVARRAAASVLSLPVHTRLSQSDLDRIVDAVRRNMESP